MVKIQSRSPAKWAACAVMLVAGVLAASNAFASQHIKTNACSIATSRVEVGLAAKVRCSIPLQIPREGIDGALWLHRESAFPKRHHTWWESNDFSSAWVAAYDDGSIHSWCPGAQIKRTCATTAGGASPQVFATGFRTFTYAPGSASNDFEDQFCPSNKPFLIKSQADTSAWW